MVSISDLGSYIGSGSQGSVWQHASEPDKIIKVMKGFPIMKDGEMDAFQYDRYLERRFGSHRWALEQENWMFAPMANKMVLYLFRETMAMRKDNLALPTGQVKVYAIEDQIFELKDMRRLYNIIVKDGNFGEGSLEAQQFKRDWLTILSPGHRHGYLMVQEKLERIGGRSRAEGQERPKVFEEWSTFLWDDFGLVTRDTKNPGNYGFRPNKELVIYDPVVAPLPEQNDWSSRNVFNRLRYAYFVYLFTDIPKINDIDEHDAHEVNKIIRRFERQIIAGNFYRIERQAEGFPGSYQPEPSLNDYGLRDIMYSGTASDNFQQTLANFGSEIDADWEDDIEWTQDTKKQTPVPKWQEEVEWNAPAPKQTKVRFPRAKADKIVATVEAHIKPYVEKMMACGSYRRGAQMIGDIDFVVILKDGYTLPQILPPNQGINWVGEQKAQVIIDGEKVDFRVTTPEAWGATILYFTGPADFNIKYRWMAKKRGLKLSEYGLFNRETDEYIAGATEADIFTAMGRPYRDPADRKGFQRSSKKKAETFEAPYQPNQTLEDYSPQDLVTSSAVTGDFTTDSLKYGFGPTALRAESSDVFGVAYCNDPEDSHGWGVVYFKQTANGVEIDYAFTGLKKGLHGFHIHEYGDLTDGCTSACAHFNPDNQVHGSLTSKVRHFGDLGNIETTGQYPFEQTKGNLFLPKAKLDTSKYGILGRMIIVHEDEDDLGQGGNEESLKTGNAGARRFCGVIGLADPKEFGSLLQHPAFRTKNRASQSWAAHIHRAEDNYEATYGVEQAKIRRRLKNKIKKQAIMGTKAGQWSARKSQELKRQYEAACEKKGLQPYKGKKTQKQKDLSNWSKQGWRTGSGKKSSTTGEAYFPAKAVAALKKKGLYAKATRQKREATKAGKQRATYSKDIQQVVADYRAEDKQLPICPICEGYIPNDERPGAYPGAISRYDNKTEVCSACGTAEGVGMMMLGDEIYVLRDEAAEFTDDPWEIWCYIIANAKEQLPPVFFGRIP